MSKQENSNSISNFFSSFDKSTQLAYIISRFYYQILGIYFPASILVTFFYFYYDFSIFYKPITELLNSVDNWYLTVLVLIGIVVITGESINIVSSRLSFLSPGSVRAIDKVKKILGIQVVPEWLNKVEWPIWFGIADYPIPFSSFDRYYLESLDKEKRSLAGKIGWTTFFRNMSIVFLIIFVIQVILSMFFSTAINSTLTQILRGPGMAALPAIIVHPDKTFYISLILPLALSFIFYLGYRSNRRSYDLVFWKSYRRSEFIKWFEAKNGSLQTVFSINSNNLGQAFDYVTDRLYYSSDQYLKSFASIILNKLEGSYKKTKEILNSNQKITCSYHKTYPMDKKSGKLEVPCSYCRAQISKVFEDTTTLLTYCYKEWREGSHELVLEKSFAALNCLDVILKDVGKSQESLGSEFWQEIRGYLLIAENFYMSAAYYDITDNLGKWGWVNKAVDSSNVPTDNKAVDSSNVPTDNKAVDSSNVPTDTGIYYKITRNLALSYDDWYRVLTSLEAYFRDHSAKNEFETFEKLKVSGTLQNFGGYNYKESLGNLEELEKSLYTVEYPWQEIKISYPNQWELIHTESDSIKIIPMSLTENGKIDIWVENNRKGISNTSDLYNENRIKLVGLPKLSIIGSKEIIVIHTLSSLITFLDQKDSVEMIGYQIIFPSKNKTKLFFIKYEEAKDKGSNKQMFERLIRLLR